MSGVMETCVGVREGANISTEGGENSEKIGSDNEKDDCNNEFDEKDETSGKVIKETFTKQFDNDKFCYKNETVRMDKKKYNSHENKNINNYKKTNPNKSAKSLNNNNSSNNFNNKIEVADCGNKFTFCSMRVKYINSQLMFHDDEEDDDADEYDEDELDNVFFDNETSNDEKCKNEGKGSDGKLINSNVKSSNQDELLKQHTAVENIDHTKQTQNNEKCYKDSNELEKEKLDNVEAKNEEKEKKNEFKKPDDKAKDQKVDTKAENKKTKKTSTVDLNGKLSDMEDKKKTEIKKEESRKKRSSVDESLKGEASRKGCWVQGCKMESSTSLDCQGFKFISEGNNKLELLSHSTHRPWSESCYNPLKHNFYQFTPPFTPPFATSFHPFTSKHFMPYRNRKKFDSFGSVGVLNRTRKNYMREKKSDDEFYVYKDFLEKFTEKYQKKDDTTKKSASDVLETYNQKVVNLQKEFKANTSTPGIDKIIKKSENEHIEKESVISIKRNEISINGEDNDSKGDSIVIEDVYNDCTKSCSITDKTNSTSEDNTPTENDTKNYEESFGKPKNVGGEKVRSENTIEKEIKNAWGKDNEVNSKSENFEKQENFKDDITNEDEEDDEDGDEEIESDNENDDEDDEGDDEVAQIDKKNEKDAKKDRKKEEKKDEYVVDVHVDPGETFSVCVKRQVQLIQGWWAMIGWMKE